MNRRQTLQVIREEFKRAREGYATPTQAAWIDGVAFVACVIGTLKSVERRKIRDRFMALARAQAHARDNDDGCDNG